jgi:hypothetical protein
MRFAVIAATVLAFAAAGCGASSDQSATIGRQIGGTCSATDFYLQNRLDGSKETIYDCTTPAKGEMCVTYAGHVATNATETVKLLFANALGSSKPSCI